MISNSQIKISSLHKDMRERIIKKSNRININNNNTLNLSSLNNNIDNIINNHQIRILTVVINPNKHSRMTLNLLINTLWRDLNRMRNSLKSKSPRKSTLK